MFRRLVRLGCFPACRRHADVTPIPKGPPSSSVASFLPISRTLIYCLRWLSDGCRFISDDLWNAVACSQPPSLPIEKVWVPVMHFCACPIHCNVQGKVGGRLGSFRLISVQPLIGTTIREFSISSVLWVLEVLCYLY